MELAKITELISNVNFKTIELLTSVQFSGRVDLYYFYVCNIL